MPQTGFCLKLLAGGAALAALTAPAQADTLKEALALAYQTNPTLEAARANQRALDESVPIQRSQGLPSVNATANYFEFLKPNAASFTAPERLAQGGVTLSVPIYAGGSVRNGVRAAEERVEAGRADLRGTESAIFSQVVGAYMDVIQNEAIVGLSANQVDVLSVNLEATSDRFEIGDLTRTDVAQSESRLALARGDLRGAEANLITVRERYIQLVGKPPVDLQPPPPLPGLPESAEDAVDIALANNPDLIAARERLVAAGYDIKVARSGRLPRLDAFIDGGYDNYLGTLGGPGVTFDQTQTTATAGLRATIPIFQGGRPAAQVRQAQAQLSAALENEIALERDIISTVRASYSSWQASRAIAASTMAAVDAAELSLEGVRAENTVGNRTIIDILDAERELLSARVQLVTARRNEYVAGFALLAAMGRAEARDLALEEAGPLYDPVVNYDRVRGIVWDWDEDPTPEPQSTRTVDTPVQDGNVADEE